MKSELNPMRSEKQMLSLPFEDSEAAAAHPYNIYLGLLRWITRLMEKIVSWQALLLLT